MPGLFMLIIRFFGSSSSASTCLIAAPCSSSAMALPMRVMKAAAMKKGAMKKRAMKAMKKGMKVMKKGKGMKKKAMKKSVVAKGRGAKARVFRGKKAKTQGGLTKEKLTKNKRGKVVSKAASAHAKKQWVKNGLKAWADAVKKARKELGVKGFVAIGGKTAAGKALYAKAKSLI